MQTEQFKNPVIVAEHHLLEDVFNSYHKNTDMSSKERKQIMNLQEYLNGLISVDAMQKKQAQEQASAKIEKDLKEYQQIKTGESDEQSVKKLPTKTKASPKLK